MKKILFVINTLGRAGAETALLELLRRLDAEEYEISLYVLLGQGEMISQVPQRVHVKNKKICTASVLSGAGRRKLIQTSFLAFFRHGRTIKKMQYVIQNFFRMKKTGNIQPDKLLWRVISDGADRFSETFDLAVAYLEGGSAYYVADHVNAKKKLPLSILHTAIPVIQGKWIGTATKRWIRSLPFRRRRAVIFWNFIRNMRRKCRFFTIFSIQTGLRVRRSCRAVFQIPIQEFES